MGVRQPAKSSANEQRARSCARCPPSLRLVRGSDGNDRVIRRLFTVTAAISPLATVRLDPRDEWGNSKMMEFAGSFGLIFPARDRAVYGFEVASDLLL